MDFKGIGPNRGWKFLADLRKEELKTINVSIKDDTRMTKRGGMKVEVMEKRQQRLETEVLVRKLQFYYIERRMHWLENGERK